MSSTNAENVNEFLAPDFHQGHYTPSDPSTELTMAEVAPGEPTSPSSSPAIDVRSNGAAVTPPIRGEERPATPAIDHRDAEAEALARSVTVAQEAPVPGGIHSRLVGPTDDDDVPVFKTYTSSRHFTSAIARTHFPATAVDFTFGKTIPKRNYGSTDLAPLERSSIDVSPLLPPADEFFWRVRPEKADLRHIVYGTIKGVIRTARVVGRVLIRDTATSIEVAEGKDWGRHMLTIAPAYAPSVAMVTDENLLKAQRAITSAFLDAPAQVRDTGRVTGRCGELLSRGVNTVRFTFRLATLYVYARFCSVGIHRQACIRADAALPHAIDIGNWNVWSAEMARLPRPNNFIPWTPPRQSPSWRDSRYLAVLSLAGCEQVLIGGNVDDCRPPIIWPEIDNVRVLGVLHGGQGAQETMLVDAAFVYEVAVAWCTRYGSVSLLREAIQFVSTMYWGSQGHGNAVCGDTALEMSLPPADMVGFLLAPILEDMDRLQPLVLADYQEDPYRLVLESALGALLLGWVRQYQLYFALDGPLERGVLITEEDKEEAFSLLTRVSPAVGAPIWMAVAETWKSLGLKGELGRCFTSLGNRGTVEAYAKRLLQRRKELLSSYDVLGFLRGAPEDTAVAGWAGCKPPALQLEPNMEYMLEDLAKSGGAQSNLRALMEIKDLQIVMVVAARNTHSVSSFAVRGRHRDFRGLLRDHQLSGYTMPDGSQVRVGFRLTTLSAAHIVNDGTHDRYNMKWYMIPYTTERPLRIKAIEGVRRDPPDPAYRFMTARHEHRSERIRLAEATNQIVRRLTGRDLPRIHLGDTFCEPEPPRRGRRSGGSSSSESSHFDYRRAMQGRPGGGSSTGSSSDGNSDNDSLPPRRGTMLVSSYEWKSPELAQATAALPVDLRGQFQTLDSCTEDEDVQAWIKTIAKAAESGTKHWFSLPEGGAPRAVGMLGVDHDIIGRFKMTLVVRIEPAKRELFLSTVAEILERLVVIYPTAESMVQLQRMIASLRVMASHCRVNPFLTATTCLRTMERLPEDAPALNVQESTPEEILRFVISANNPTRTVESIGNDMQTRRRAVSPELLSITREMIAYLDTLGCQCSDSKIDVGEALKKQFPEATMDLPERDSIALSAKVCATAKLIVEREKAALGAQTTCRGFFIERSGPPDSSEDDEEPPLAGPSTSTPTGVRQARRSRRQSRRKSRRDNGGKQGGKQNALGTKLVAAELELLPGQQVSPKQGTCPASKNNRHESEWADAPLEAHALKYLLRGCACSLEAEYGGRWNGVGLQGIGCALATNYVSATRWWKSLSTDEQALYMVEQQAGAAGVEHFSTLFDANLPVESPSFSIEKYSSRLAWFESKIKPSQGNPKGADLSGDQARELVMEAIREHYPEDSKRKSDFQPIKMQGGMPVVLTSKILLEAHPYAGPMIEVLHNKSPESEEYEVATTALALLSIDELLLVEIFCQGWFDERLREWHRTFKDLLTRAKRSNIFGRVRGEVVLQTRKLLSATIRVKGEAEIEVELQNRVYGATPKTVLWYSPSRERQLCEFLGSEGITPLRGGGALDGMDAYRYLFCAISLNYWKRVVDQLGKQGLGGTIDEHWKERAINAPGGASTLIKHTKREDVDDRFRQEDRLSKKMVVEVLDDTFLQETINGTPLNRAGYFVKPEPGRKLRALYSSYDHEMFLSSYASKGIENIMHVIPGVMVRQTPHDVLDWMAQSENDLDTRRPDPYWLSTDYSDYNSEHTMEEMAIIEATHAIAWKQCSYGSNDGKNEKALAALWIARSYSNSWICWGLTPTEGWQWERGDHGGWVLTDGSRFTEEFTEPKEELLGRKHVAWSRVVNGLYSGHRDTARNNTWIHAIDMLVARYNLRQAGVPWRGCFTALCGDDEDVKFESPLDAALYYNTLSPGGHNLNPTKQLGGRDNHEFLQLVWATTVRVEKPLCALLSTLGTGNWYSQLGLWIQSAVGSCIANWWEAHVRGVPLGKARRLCASYLDRLLYLPPSVCEGTEWEKTGKQLEWWSYRMAPAFQPLFWDTPGATSKLPRFEAAPKPKNSWPRKASLAYVETQKPLLQHLPKDFSAELEEVTLQSTVATCLKSWCQRDAKRWAARHWPAQVFKPPESVWQDTTTVGRDELNLARFRLSTPRRKRVVDENTIYARMGVSLFIGRKMGGLRGLARVLPPKQWGRATNIDRESYVGNYSFHTTQTNIRAALSYWRVPHPQFHGTVEPTAHNKLNYIFMANAAGKSHLCRTSESVDDLDVVWSDLYGAFRENFEAANPTSSFSQVAKVARDIVCCSKNRKAILVGQLQPTLVSRAVKELRCPANLMYYDPGEELREERMRRRGWDEDKIARRIKRARQLYDEAKTLGWTELESEEALLRAVQKATEENQEGATEWPLTLKKQHMQYVFDRTELVTRRLEIVEEKEKH